MIAKGSRYEHATLFTGDVDFQGIRPREIGMAHGVIEHIVREGDRLDHLAGHYYDDDRRWWRIADANPTFLFADDMVEKESVADGSKRAPGEAQDEGMVGKTIVIPRARE